MDPGVDFHRLLEHEHALLLDGHFAFFCVRSETLEHLHDKDDHTLDLAMNHLYGAHGSLEVDLVTLDVDEVSQVLLVGLALEALLDLAWQVKRLVRVTLVDAGVSLGKAGLPLVTCLAQFRSL